MQNQQLLYQINLLNTVNLYQIKGILQNCNQVFTVFLVSRCLSPTEVKKIKDQIEKERKTLKDQQNLAEDEKLKVEKELQKRENELTKAQ